MRTARAPQKAEEIARRVEAFYRDAFSLDLKIELRYAPTFQGAIYNGGKVVYGDGFARVDAIAHAVGHSLVSGEEAESFCETVGSMISNQDVSPTVIDQMQRLAARARIPIREFVPPAGGAEAPQLRVGRKPPRASK